MAEQLALPGMDDAELAEARAEKDRLEIAWEASAEVPPGVNGQDWMEALDWGKLQRLQREYFVALIRVEKLTLGRCWWH